MPTSCLRPCAFPSCPTLVAKGRCRAHAKRPWMHALPSRHARGYGAAWDRTRAEVLVEEPVCRLCARPSTTVDHIVPKVRGGTDARVNLRGLCREHQQSKSGREGAEARR